MAKATAYCTCEKCGKEFTKITYKQNSREARSWEAWAEANITECDDCQAARIQAARDEENKKSAEQAKMLHLPVLEGSPKQVAWAETIRVNAMDTLRESFARKREDAEGEDNEDLIKELLDEQQTFLWNVIGTLTSAAWWIDNRCSDSARMWTRKIAGKDEKAWNELQKAAKARIEGKVSPEASQADESVTEAEPETPVQPEAMPENQTHDGAAVIEITASKAVVARYEKNDDFRAVVKDAGFSWQYSTWRCIPDEKTGDAENVAADLGNRLLKAGFAVIFPSQEIMEKSVTGDFEPITKNWISVVGANKHFIITHVADDNMYKEAKRIPGSKWDRFSQGLLVPASSWAEIQDFARENEFKLTQGAQELLAQMGKASVVVNVADPASGSAKQFLNENGIIPDLMDEA